MGSPEEENERKERLINERDQLIAGLVQRMRLTSFPAGETIVYEGELALRMYVVIKGIVTMRKTRLMPWAIMGDVLREGDAFGDDIILREGRRHYSVQALTFVDIAYLD